MDFHDYSSCGADIPPGNSTGVGIDTGCHRKSSSIVAITIMLRLFGIQATGTLDSGLYYGRNFQQ